MQNLLLTDLVVDLPAAVRLQRLAAGLRAHFRCGAVALLQLEADHLRPVAVDGLTVEVDSVLVVPQPAGAFMAHTMSEDLEPYARLGPDAALRPLLQPDAAAMLPRPP